MAVIVANTIDVMDFACRGKQSSTARPFNDQPMLPHIAFDIGAGMIAAELIAIALLGEYAGWIRSREIVSLPILR